MAALDFAWTEDSLTEDDRRLIDAYAHVGLPVDDLAYTEDFDELVALVHGIKEQEVPLDLKHRAFRRLLNLRKRGRLPRLVRSSSSSDSTDTTDANK